MQEKKVELIAPAGDMTGLVTALKAGADAVYFGAEGYNMRAGSSNFTPANFPELKRLCTTYKAKGYLALNTIVYDGELKKMTQTVAAAKQAGIDAIICSDMAVIESCRKAEIPFHISTQASVSNYRAAKFYADLGAKMIVLARELTLEQVRHIIGNIKSNRLDLRIECFVHGAMCVAVSGRCFMSQELFGRSANRGECVQPCRRQYIITALHRCYTISRPPALRYHSSTRPTRPRCNPRPGLGSRSKPTDPSESRVAGAG